MNIIKPNLTFRGTLTPLNINKIQYIVLHHIEAKNATINDIHQWHLDNGWSGVGYNEYVRKDGTIYEGRGLNIGAQVAGFNSISYGIGCEGQFNIETMGVIQLDALVARLIELKKQFPNAKIVRHKDLQNSECPGNNFPYETILKLVNKPEVNDISDAINKLVDAGIIKSPDYWRECTKPGAMAKGEYVAQLIKNFANKLGV